MYWTPAKMLLLADVGEFSFANTALIIIDRETWKDTHEIRIVTSVPADALAPSVAGTSAGTVMTKFIFHVYFYRTSI